MKLLDPNLQLEPAGSTAVQEWWGVVDYQVALDRMTEAHARRVAGNLPDSFFYLEHPPVITYGRATPPGDILNSAGKIPAKEVPRGGLATYHAPGQLVGYIVMDLRQRADLKPDIHAYLHAIELGLISFLNAQFNLDATTRDGFTGVWTRPTADAPNGRKLASIGVNARKWVTSHGFALNIHPDMAGFQQIVPCGITDATMTSVEQELTRKHQPFAAEPTEKWAREAHPHLVSALQSEGWLIKH